MVRFLALAMVASVAACLSICPAMGEDSTTGTLAWDIFAGPADKEATNAKLDWDIFAPQENPSELGKAAAETSVPRIIDWDIFRPGEPLARPLSVGLNLVTTAAACNGPECTNEQCSDACEQSSSCANGACRMQVTTSSSASYRETVSLKQKPKWGLFKRKAKCASCR